MGRDAEWWLAIPKPVRDLPADIAATISFTILTILVVLLPVIRDTPVRVVLGLPFVLFIPGYAFIAALFPEAGTSPQEGMDDVDASESWGSRGIDGIERVALSFGLSIAIVPLIGLVLNFTPWGIRLVPILLSVSGFTIGASIVAAKRRWEIPESDRFVVPYREWYLAAKTELFEPDSRTDAALNVLLVISILLATASVAYAVAVPKQGESFTEFYILTEDNEGDLVAADYPTEFTVGESKPIIIGIGNQEHRPVEYTWVSKVQRVRIANNSTTVLESQELDRGQVYLEHNQTRHLNYSIEPRMTGQRLRLVFLLYTESPGDNPTLDTAYRETHLWINVSEPN